eukprot:m.88181 g.88181  ORF g.88181 m.88181 type:complete len:62 (-) comp26162_c0_seq1:1834-2019(-)
MRKLNKELYRENHKVHAQICQPTADKREKTFNVLLNQNPADTGRDGVSLETQKGRSQSSYN